MLSKITGFAFLSFGGDLGEARFCRISCYEPNNFHNRLMIRYNWRQNDWPNFTYQLAKAEDEVEVPTTR